MTSVASLSDSNIQSWETATRPLNIAHRGASGFAPENTLLAFRKAAELGADGVELDVQRCATGEVVVTHDETMQRLSGKSFVVRESSLSKLHACDVGAWFGEEFRGEKIPTLDEVFAAIPGMLVNVELKLGLRDDPRPLCAAVAALVKSQPAGRILISSFHPVALFVYRRYDPQTPLGYLYSAKQSLPFRSGVPALGLKPFAMHPEHSLLSRNLPFARKVSKRVNTWTVNEPVEIEAALRAGVNGVISNYPDRVGAAMQRLSLL
jgi:glycerophosphoryl diester phosphodiesterase